MTLAQLLPFWPQLSPQQQQQLARAAVLREAKAGTVLHRTEDDCLGMIAVADGQLRAYLSSEQGREITLFRLLPRDICLFSASCAIPGLENHVIISVQQDAAFWVVAPAVYRELVQTSAAAAAYINGIMASRLSDMMWLVDQLFSRSMDARVAVLLLEESALQQTDAVRVTHDGLARHLGTVREVVTRVLHYLKAEGLIALSGGGRGASTITLLDRPGLEKLL